jgi:Reverse gyrase
MLRPYIGLIKRIEFHEVTRRAIMGALASPRDINLSMVAAQTVRRIEDRWLGFGLSRKVQEAHGLAFLSAGRVQTPVLGWIVERYENSRAERKFDVVLKIDNGQIRLALPEDVYRSLKETEGPWCRCSKRGRRLYSLRRPTPRTSTCAMR